MSTVKRQHYVWRHYLRPWAKNESIWTYLKEYDRIEKSNLMGVAQERYFYKLADFTEDEEKFLEKYIDRFSPERVKGLNFDFLWLFTSTSQLKKQLDKTINSQIEKEKYTKEIEKLEINLMEISHGKIELLGQKLLTYRNLDDLKTIEEDDYLIDAIMFLCFQYFRTKNMRKLALQSFTGGAYEELAKKSWNILSYMQATTLAEDIYFNPNTRFIFIENGTNNHFITSDQPAFNILNDQTNEIGEVTQLEFYYPISPKCALKIHFRNEQADKYISVEADEAMIYYLNKKVLNNADFFVFAETKKQLEELK